MKRILPFLLFLISLSASAQYNNEWIRNTQTYFKFKILNKGLYRISKTALDAAGIGNAGAEYFELWRNGKQVPIYTSSASGPLASNGYIEFWGEGNDGKPDKSFYRNPAYQHSTEISLVSDSAVYFLSVNTNQSGFTYVDPGNDVAGNSLPAEPYFMDKSATYYRDKINPGFAAVVGEYVYSSSYDKGEFWSSAPIRPATPLVTTKTGLNVYGAGPDATLSFGSMGDALNPRSLKVSVNGNLLADTAMDYFNDLRASVSVPLAMISGGTAAVRFENTSSVTTDRLVVSFFEIFYPKPFNFNNQKFYKFNLPASGAKYIEVTNFNYGSSAPVLFNITTGERITGDISTPGIVKLVVPAGGAREFVLVNTEASNVIAVNTLTPKTFKVFTDPANQGDYLIITNKALFTGSNGNNPVDEYKNYRASAAGGGYNVQVIDIDELVDQFGFGIKKNPLGVKNFIRFARNNFTNPVKHVFLIGRGMAYNEYRLREGDAVAEQLNLVPSWGNPASDNMLSSEDAASPVAVTPIGRLSVVKGKEIEDYLEKVKEYEATQKNAANTLEGREWMKNIVHVTGSSDPYLGTVLCNYMHVYRQIIQDTVYGGKVSTFCKVSTNSVEQLNNEKIALLFEEGISILTYFGHSSSTTLEFNLDNPQAYNNQGKYPVFFVNGCNAGNFFTYNAARLSLNETLSEKFVLAKQRGGIAFVASTHFGIVNYLNIYLNNLYGKIAKPDFGKSLGETVRDALNGMITLTGPNDYYARLHAEEMTIHGDPAVFINEQAAPDYIIEEAQVLVNPAFISVAEESFQMKIKSVNLGKSVSDSIIIEVKRQYPDGSSEVISRKKIAGIRYADSVTVNVPIVATRDKGLNKFTITVDADNIVDEITESNNTIIKDVFIYEDEARTVYPYNYAIITNPTQKLSASTANPLSQSKQYVMEMDTTGLFNSAFKISKTVTSVGGLIEFDPGITYVDKRVYYWRVSPVPENSSATHVWNTASFIYINGTKEGFNQSHRYQHSDSKTERMSLNENGKWVFGTRSNHLFVRNGVYPFSGRTDNDFSIDVNGTVPIASACVGQSLIFNVFDSVTFKPWKNVSSSGANLYLSGSGSANCVVTRNYNFEFSYMTAQSRKYMMNFMDSIPNGSFVVVRNVPNSNYGSNTYINTWQADTALYGSFNSLYHRLLAAGFTKVDSLTFPRSFIFIYKKGNYDFVPKMEVSQGINDRVSLSAECITPDSLGFITSPAFGPAKSWGEVIWNGASVETVSNDNPTVDVIGVDPSKIETVLFTMDRNTHNLDISTVDATAYPQMKLRMRNIDSVSLSPYQLTDWKIYYQPLPEGAIAPNILIDLKDTLEVGEPMNIAVAFKNISPHPFDSVAVKMNVVDKNNVSQNIVVPNQKPLVSGDTIALRMTLDSKNYADGNTLFLEFNPAGNQPEQYHFNNFLFKNFFVRVDRHNPLMDVTFDGVHILNRDLVSARPHIQIKLKDDAKFLLMNDTTLSSVQIRYPDGTIRTHHFDNDTLRFTPATSASDNSAVVDFYPVFDKQYNPEGDEYELIVNGRDRSGNKASNDYRIAFTVITKAMISNMLNYPNPFSTSTAFVFTITGSEIPQNMKVQILTVTGKIVREVTKDELGPLHIGRNITEFKWDGTDQFGQKLANGVYLYRFVTTLNGQRMEKYKAKGDNTDMFFNNGYGKMYLMR